ncbi:MAG: ribonuclease D [Alphaproteobacteria bacterium]|nr:ribonuclease D [Alphaproteobacteria bacterium]
MHPVTTTDALAELCRRLATHPYIAIDTEFLRERTYYPILCLIQVASHDEAVAIDPMAEGISLDPLYELLADPKVLKVFHAARQDIEIFVHKTNRVPAPLFDTQVAGMVCGFGDSVSYETLVGKLTGQRLDKSSRFSDWSHRPLTDRQLTYALADVVPLCRIYEVMEQKLQSTGRRAWLAEEWASLTDVATYRGDPESAWRRLKPKSTKPKTLAILAELAAWREIEAQRRDVPRQRILKDEALTEVANQGPKSLAELGRVRLVPQGFAEGKLGADLLAAVERGRHRTPPTLDDDPRGEAPLGRMPLVDLLKVLLKLRCEDFEVAPKIVASSADIEALAAFDDANIPALRGWRREVFGDAALKLKAGRLALAGRGGRIEVIELPEAEEMPDAEFAQARGS